MIQSATSGHGGLGFQDEEDAFLVEGVCNFMGVDISVKPDKVFEPDETTHQEYIRWFESQLH
eukprot:9370678-Karenia_brevis.AAC.1